MLACRPGTSSRPRCARRAIRIFYARSAATVRRLGGWPEPSDARGLVHSRIRQAIGVRIGFAANVLERHAADFVREQASFRVQRHQPRIFHFVVAEHLLNEQQRIRANVQVLVIVALGPFERREQPAVLGHVVRGDSDRLAELFDERAVLMLDSNPEPRWTRIAPSTAVDVGDDHSAGGVAPVDAGGPGT